MRPALAVLLPLSLLLAACPGTRSRPSGGPRPPGPDSMCGNSRIDSGETCDKAIAAGQPGACPADCSDGSACTMDTLIGSAANCNAACSSMPISNCANGDGCCPEGCTNTNDDDCSATCGDGVVDPGETCDQNCPASCDDGVACTIDSAVGSIASCSFSCAYSSVAACTAGDGCCGPGCTNANDSDCSATCGNSMIDAGESCDGDCPTSCDDGNACTVDIFTGSPNTCNVACARQVLTECRDADGCCPAGCGGRDSDCSTTCGNGSIDSGETCDGDCPTSCESSVCEVATYVGSPSNCNAACVITPITACADGDGCCPSQCSSDTDSDCSNPPGGDIGDPCVDATACADYGTPFTSICVNAFPGGYCAAFCVDGACPTGSHCALDFDGLCVKECTSGTDCREPDYVCRALFDTTEQTFMGCAPPGN